MWKILVSQIPRSNLKDQWQNLFLKFGRKNHSQSSLSLVCYLPEMIPIIELKFPIFTHSLATWKITISLAGIWHWTISKTLSSNVKLWGWGDIIYIFKNFGVAYATLKFLWGQLSDLYLLLKNAKYFFLLQNARSQWRIKEIR